MRVLALLLLLFSSCATCVAQSAPLSATAAAPPLAAESVRHPLPDSVRQAVQQVFRRGRRFSVIAGLSGLAVLGSGITYAAHDGPSLGTYPDILLGSGAAATGAIGRAQYSRRRERQALEVLERGYRLPAYVAEVAPLLPKRNRRIVLSYL